MEKEFKKIDETLNRLYELHKSHMDSFDKSLLPDLEKQSKERDIEVATLVKTVSNLAMKAENKTGTTAESMILAINDRVTVLLEQNKALQTKVSVIRERLKKGMEQISKGKKVIHSYRSSAAVSNTPKAINITTY
ncbi:MAG: hypothetical protein KKF12_06520 [Proteobacteria bacterium]|nr:hypothetical protein [Desulfobacula sp.]MBU3951405.1 hypothetical protein [Pseudomonadota bacterium]MBU4130454.1 hypothetical protein [Pseudomonadota bacterium]